MTPTLLFPAGLAALVALAVPLAIHLAREADLRRTDFAALRWLTPRPRPRARRRFDEWWLLAARLVLLALIALWLARPAVFGAADTTPYVAVAPGVDLDQLPVIGAARRHWVAPGFPPIDTPPPGRQPVASLIRELDATLPPATPLRLIVPPVIDGADAERPRLSRRVTWQVVGEGSPAPTAAPPSPAPSPTSGTSPGFGASPAVSASPPSTAAPSPPVTVPPALAVRFAPGQAARVRFFRAAAVAWAPPGGTPAFNAGPPTEALPPKNTILVWLVPGPLPPKILDWARGDGTVLADAATVEKTGAASVGTSAARSPGHVATGIAPASTTATDSAAIWRDEVGAPLAVATPLGRGRVLRLTQPLDPAVFPQLLEPTFPKRLRAMLAPPSAEPARVTAANYAPRTGAAAYPQPARDLRPWLAVVIAGAFLAERLLATARRARAAP